MAGANGTAPGLNGRAYNIVDHTYDVVVVGAGGRVYAPRSARPRPASRPRV